MGDFLTLVKGWSIISLLIRLTMSFLVGFVIGLDRVIKRRGAGVKTHILVCLSSTLVMMTGQFIQLNYDGSMDVARLGAQVISGVGFLGVGTIIVTGRNQVRGLTTAAGLWACACIGLAIGIGFIDGAFLTFLFILITFTIMRKVDSWMHKYAKIFDLYIEFPTNQSVSLFIKEMHEKEVKVSNFEIGKSKIKGEGPNAIMCVEVNDVHKRKNFIEEVRKLNCVTYVEEL